MQHPDEGTIHTWLDGALPDEEARAVEAHVASCAPCAAMVAEARGLAARASSILGALDDVPAGVLPGRSRVRRAGPAAWWRRPAVGMAAAMAIVATGTMMAVTREWGSRTYSPAEAVSSEFVLPPAETPAPADSPATGTARGPVPASPIVERQQRGLEADVAELKAAPLATGTVARAQVEAVASTPEFDSTVRAEESRLADRAALAPPPSETARQRVAPVAQAPQRLLGNVITSAASLTGCYEFESGRERDAMAPPLPALVQLTESADAASGVAAAAPSLEQAFVPVQSPVVVPPAIDTVQPGWRLTPADSVAVRLAIDGRSVMVTFRSPATNPEVGRVNAAAQPGISSWTGTVIVRQVPCRRE